MRKKSFILLISILFVGCVAKHAPVELANLDTAKNDFVEYANQGIPTVIKTYFDDYLHDPSSFQFIQFTYTYSNNFAVPVRFEREGYRGGTIVEYKIEFKPVYRIEMSYRATNAMGGLTLHKTNFYLLSDNRLLMPNRNIVALNWEKQQAEKD